MEKELEARKNKAWGESWSLKNVFENRKLNLKAKIRVVESCVLSVLCYGAQTWSYWSLTKAQTEKLQNTQRTMERKILDIRKRDKISNS